MLRKIGIRKIGIHKFPKCQFSRVPLHWRGHSANRLRLHLEGRGAVTALRPTPFSVSSPTPGELGSRQQKRGCVENKVGRCQRILTALKTYYDYDSDSDSDGSIKVAWVSKSEIFVWFWRLDKSCLGILKREFCLILTARFILTDSRLWWNRCMTNTWPV